MNESVPVETTAERLLRATLAVVAEHGVAGATSRQLATAAGTNLQAITYHFGSKDELIAQALTAAVREWVAPIRELLADLPRDPAGRLAAALSGLDQLSERVIAEAPAYLEALAQVPRRPEFAEPVRSLFADLRGDVEAVLAELKAAGLLGEWVEPAPMAALVVAAADGVAVHLALEPDALAVGELLDQVEGLLLAALNPRPGLRAVLAAGRRLSRRG